MSYSMPEEYEDAIAIVGMAARFPGANNVEEFWKNLCNGVASITFFSDEALIAAGVEPALPRHPNFVKAGAVLSDIEYFDAAFFGFSPKEASIMDPQQRLFLECGWEALENAGLDPSTYPGAIGVVAGASTNQYLLLKLRHALQAVKAIEMLQTLIGKEKDFLATKLSYKLNLTGPSLTVQTACSTSLVAVHLACQSLLNGECDVALAGGVAIRLPQAGYFYQEGGILSPDGYCRPFDAKAQGTFAGNGVGIVVLKRLDEALADGDCIDAIIRGSAINNDGSLKVGYTAPSQQGQAKAITEALRVASVEPASISYIETHGTGTALGDPIEIAALTEVFAGHNSKCAIGAVKSNIGHLDSAAGVAGLIKTVLALKHKWQPPTLHFERANPQIDFASSPFYVNTALTEWKSNGSPRRAGVSSFGIGGTNAHVILEEAPPSEPTELPEVVESQLHSRVPLLLPLSARHPQALKELAYSYQKLLANSGPTLWLKDICYSASLRRSHHKQRLAVVGHSHEELIEALEPLAAEGPASTLVTKPQTLGKQIVFVFSGHGSQWWGMGRQLLTQEPLFRETLEECDQAMQRAGGLKCSLLAELNASRPNSRLEEVDILQPCLFAIQVSLAALWRSWGISPSAVVGHSMGEVAAAYVAGALSLEEAARVICWRSRLIKRVSGQGMTAFVALSLPEAEKALAGRKGLSVAATNGPKAIVLSGEPAAVEELLQALEQQEVFCRLVKMDYASHSHQMDPLRPDLRRALKGLQPGSASVAFYSTVTGDLLDGQTLDATYWAQNLRAPVLFSTATQRLIENGHHIFLEMSAHPILLPAIDEQLHHLAQSGVVLPSMRRNTTEREVILKSLGTLYELGHDVKWKQLYSSQYNFVRLPSYPWQRQRYWVEQSVTHTPTAAHAAVVPTASRGVKKEDSINAEQGLTIKQLIEAEPSKRHPLLERYLSQEAARLLGFTNLDVQQPLSQLGFDSLMTVVLKNRLKEHLGLNVPTARFLQNPTITQLTTHLLAQLAAEQRDGIESGYKMPLRSKRSLGYSPLVPIQPAGSKPPFFCVHPWAGVVYPYYELANELGADQPFYGLQSVGMYGQPDRTIEEMATHYIEALRSVSKGPYLLGGWSFGALVAFEMALQLHRGGDEVALLALFDTPAPLDDKRLTLLTSLKFLITISSRYIWPYIYDYFAIALRAKDVVTSQSAVSSNGKLRQAFSKRFAMAKSVLQEVRSLTKSESTTRRIFSTFQSNGQAAINYVPQPYFGRVTLFRVLKQLVPDDQEQSLGWNKLAVGGVEVQMIPGHHLNCLRKPHVKVLAAQLSASIDQIQLPTV